MPETCSEFLSPSVGAAGMCKHMTDSPCSPCDWVGVAREAEHNVEWRRVLGKGVAPAWPMPSNLIIMVILGEKDLLP